jgi:hypothetical protein
MKRIFAIFASLLALTASAATLNPVSLLNPAGSTAGQAIVSTGASTAPVWGAVPLTGITGTLAITNGGTGATTATNARTNLGLGTSATVNTGTSGATIPLLSTANTWTLGQSFSTLSATGLITPAATVGIKGTATNDNPAAGSFGEYVNAQTVNTSMTSGTAANCASLTLTAGDWDVTGVIVYIPAGTTTVQSLNSSLTSASATAAAFPNYVATGGGTTGVSQAVALPTVRFNSPSGITAYAVGSAGFGVSTMQCSGFLRARRPR